MYYAFVGIITFAGLAMMVQHGIWNNLINLIAIQFAAVIAYGAHQPIVVYLDEQTEGAYTYLLDFPVLWFTFALFVLIFKGFANLLSKNRVNFPEQADGIGGAVIGLLAGYLLACFSMSTFYAAPLAKDPLGGGGYDHGATVKAVQQEMQSQGALTKPDFTWLAIAGSLLSPEAYGSAEGFEPAIFVQQHTKHRELFESLDTSIVRRSR